MKTLPQTNRMKCNLLLGIVAILIIYSSLLAFRLDQLQKQVNTLARIQTQIVESIYNQTLLIEETHHYMYKHATITSGILDHLLNPLKMEDYHELWLHLNERPNKFIVHKVQQFPKVP